jgi:spermidine synthase
VNVLARARSERGEVVLRRRDEGALELRVNGVFVMDSTATSSEGELARSGLARVRHPRRVLVAGLGLGFTLRAVLDDPRVEQVTVVELEPAVVDWLRGGLVPGGAALLDDPRVSVVVGDVVTAVAGLGRRTYDVLLLDVDNGPGFLVHEENAVIYRVPFLRVCADLLDEGGTLAVWSMNESEALVEQLRTVFAHVGSRPCPVRLGTRDETYWLHHASAPARSGHAPAH